MGAADRHLQRIGIDTTRLAMLDTLSQYAVAEARAALGADTGISNKQLAGQLYINVRIVEAHTNHIMRKLGVSSRAQIAVWATTHRP